MGIVDLIILGVLLMVALIGWHRGWCAARCPLVGTIGGGLLAAASPSLDLEQPRRAGPGRRRDQCRCGARRVGLGNALVVTLGRPLWMALQVGPARIVDAAAGAVMSLFAGLIAMWLVAATVASPAFPPHWRRRCAPRRCCSRSSASLRHRPPTWRTRCANCWTRCICRKSSSASKACPATRCQTAQERVGCRRCRQPIRAARLRPHARMWPGARRVRDLCTPPTASPPTPMSWLG